MSVCDAVRRAVGPGFPIEVRISGSECYEGGYDVEEGVAFARQLEGHCDLIHVSAGSHEVREVFTRTHPDMYHGESPNLCFAAEIKKAVSVPVATVGAHGNEPAFLEEIIASGKADVIEMARSLLADPDLPLKLRTGREDEIRPCLRCLYCFSSELTCGEPYCAVNPESGREIDMKYAPPAAVARKKVLVAGGGVGGMEAALECARRGHQVILCEKGSVLGGGIRCEERVPFKKYVGVYLDRQAAAIRAAVKAGTATAGDLDHIGGGARRGSHRHGAGGAEAGNGGCEKCCCKQCFHGGPSLGDQIAMCFGAARAGGGHRRLFAGDGPAEGHYSLEY